MKTRKHIPIAQLWLCIVMASSGTCCYAPPPAEVNPNSPTDANAHAKYFPIAAADGHGSTLCPECTCAACHGDANSFTVVACITCHMHTAQAEQLDHNTVVNYVYESHACLECHPGATVSK